MTERELIATGILDPVVLREGKRHSVISRKYVQILIADRIAFYTRDRRKIGKRFLEVYRVRPGYSVQWTALSAGRSMNGSMPAFPKAPRKHTPMDLWKKIGAFNV